MNISPEPAPYRPDVQITSLGEKIGDRVEAAEFPKAILRFRNDRWAKSVGLADLSDEEWRAHFARFEPLPDNIEVPLALRYHGHQFRVYNPEIGDGRGFLFAQMRDHENRLMDLGTKGSGQTPWSRSGDGRLTLKGGVREILATEMLEALGVETSKSFSLIETGEQLWRGDEPSPTRSSVLVRLSHSHIRIGTFQRIAFEGNAELMRKLIGYCLDHYYGGAKAATGEDRAAELLGHVTRETARLAASYMAAGFVHGVLNSDNIAITAESFDYGPWRFAPAWDLAFTAAYFDHAGLYAFGRQAEAINWDLGQLAVSLRLIARSEPLIEALQRFAGHYLRFLGEHFCWRLGLEPKSEAENKRLIELAERALGSEKILADRFFFDWMGRTAAPAGYSGEAWAALAEALREFEIARPREAHAYWQGDDPCSMHIEEVEALWSAIADDDDWSPFERKITAVRRLGEAMKADA